jgi:hypothetical protein
MTGAKALARADSRWRGGELGGVPAVEADDVGAGRFRGPSLECGRKAGSHSCAAKGRNDACDTKKHERVKITTWAYECIRHKRLVTPEKVPVIIRRKSTPPAPTAPAPHIDASRAVDWNPKTQSSDQQKSDDWPRV